MSSISELIEISIKEIYGKEIEFDELSKVSKRVRVFHIWELSETDLSLSGLNREGILSFLNEQGFFVRKSKSRILFSRVINNVIEYVSIKEIIGFLKDYVFEIENKVLIKKQSTSIKLTKEQFRDTFLKQHHLVLNEGFLSILAVDNRELLRDTKETAYLLFNNVVISIKKDKIQHHNYEEFEDKIFFKSQVIDSNYTYENDWINCAFAKFIKNIAVNSKDRKDSIRSGIGYLLHDYNDPTKSQAVILYDEEITDSYTPKGGTGKGVFGQSIKYIKNGFVTIDGKGINLNSQFLFQQIKEDTRVVFFDDVAKNFDIDRLNSTLTEGVNVEKKFKETYHISKELMPKFLISSNVILPFSGSTRMRRQFIIEISNYYSSQIRNGNEEPIIKEHKNRFFSSDWNEFEWNGYYTFMIKSLQFYLKNGLIQASNSNVEINSVVQKIGKAFYNWANERFNIDEKEFDLSILHLEYIEQFNIESESYSQRKFSNNLSQYFKGKHIEYAFKKGKLYVKNKIE